MAGTTSQGTTAPSITPWDIASGTCGIGMPMGAAPSARSASPAWRVGKRSLRPRRSSMVFTSRRAWITPASCAQAVMTWVSPNSPRMCLSNNSQVTRAFTLARLCGMKGSSMTSMRGKRPGVLPGSVQMMSATPSFAWSYSCGGAPPNCMEGNIWMRRRPLLSSCTLRAQGIRKWRCTLETGGRKWCSRSVTSWAAARRGVNSAGAASAAPVSSRRRCII